MDFDVAIIGGGPAGCAAAITLQAKGCSVIVIAAPSAREKPTETAVPALRQILHGLDVPEALSACEPCYGIVSAWGRKSPALQPSIISPLGHAWFIHRTRFDSCLQNTARNGGSTWMNEEAQTVHFNPDRISIATTGQSIHTRWVIFATGSPSWPARITRQKPSKMDSMIAFWAHLCLPLQERFLFVEPTDLGWWYLCPADGPGAIACFVTDLASARTLASSNPTKWNELFQATRLSQQLQGEALADRVHVALSGLAALPQKHGHRWTAAGDAATKLDPLGSSGTASALDSGQRAAHAVADALKGNNAALDRYGRWSTDLVEEFARQRRQQYTLETLRHSNGFWSRRTDSGLHIPAAT